MAVTDHPDFDAHEAVLFVADRRVKLHAIIELRDTSLGPALGGVRMYPYATEEAALTDVLRLLRGMTYKNALASVPMGGGKAVIIADPRCDLTDRLLIGYATQVNQLGGRYVTAEDLGMSLADLKLIAQHSPYVTGVADADHQGDPAPKTALGVYLAMRAAVQVVLGLSSLSGITVAIQGLGNVGWALARRLHADGARLIVADTDSTRTELAAAEFGARAVSTEEILTIPADVLSPCVLGGVLNAHTIARLRVAVICGCANNATGAYQAQQNHLNISPSTKTLSAPLRGASKTHQMNCKNSTIFTNARPANKTLCTMRATVPTMTNLLKNVRRKYTDELAPHYER